jgi:competence protein ComEA
VFLSVIAFTRPSNTRQAYNLIQEKSTSRYLIIEVQVEKEKWIMIRKSVLSLVIAVFVGLFLSAVCIAAEPVVNKPAAKLDINTASAAELIALDGIGKSYADRIVEYRKANGPFKTAEDIMKVSGIGKATWEKLKDKITAGAVAPATAAGATVPTTAAGAPVPATAAK